jgi:hypothetical protein
MDEGYGGLTMKKILAIVLALLILLFSGSSFAASGDVSTSASYYSAVERILSLGIMDNVGSGTFKPNDSTTREQFAKLIIITAGLGDSADTMKGSTVFSDVPSNGANSGYINLCISKGYMTGMADGKFHPKDAITYSQAVTAMIKVLGYTNADIPGTWPKNYMEKAKALGISSELTLSTGSNVPRWAMAQMLDVLLDTTVKSGNAADAAKTLAETSGLTTDILYTVYSKPEVYYKANLVNSKLGTIDLSGSLSIVRNSADHSTSPVTVINGEALKASDIKDFNIVYQVSDKSGKNKYVLVIDNKLSGTITGILPNKYTPKQVQVDGTTYDLDKDFSTARLSGTNSFNINDSVTLLLGYDGKVADIQEALYSDNSSFAFVKNYTSITSNDAANYGLKKYTVKLMMSNGSINNFDCNNDPSPLKGKLVIYKKLSNGSVTLTGIDYSTPGQLTIRKDDRQILTNYDNYINYFSGNVKIFNFISNANEVDAQAEILNWSDLPAGVLQSGDVLYMNKTGSFEDVNLILLNNISVKDYKLGVVKTYRNLSTPSSPSYSFTITVDGKDLSYNTTSNDYGISTGSVLKVAINGNSISNILEVKFPDTQSSMIQAVDKDRIRANSRTYSFADNSLIYLVDSTGSAKTIENSQLRTDTVYGDVSIYTDVPSASGGKAELVIIRSN